MSDRVNTETVADLLSKWESSSSEPINIVVAGKHGSGKTTLVSALCGLPVVKQINPSILLNNQHFIPDYDITVSDACGMFETSVSWKRDLAITKMKEIKCLSEANKVSLIYTIPINQSEFQNSDEDIDVKCMKRLTTEFGEQIWRHSIIVLTFANEDYESKKKGLKGDNDDERHKSYLLEVARWENIVKECLKTFVLSEDEAKKIPIVPAGYIKHLLALACLEHESDGESWVMKTWCKIAERAPENVQHKLLAFCFYKVFQSPFFYFDSYLALVKIHGQLYRMTCTVQEFEGCHELGLAYSYLRILKQWYDNYYEQLERNIKCSREALGMLQFWRAFNTTIQIVVTGANHCGKTSLINSMLYGKNQFQETPDNNITGTSQYKHITYQLQESSLESLQQVDVDDVALLLVCIMLNDTEETIKRTLAPIADKNPSNLMVVLTFADVNLSGNSWNEIIQKKTESIKHILTELKVNSAIIEKLRVVPAGYHREITITNDPSNTHWIMNVWVNSIASAKVSCQSAMALFVNYFVYGGQKRNIVSPCHEILYRDHLLQILYDMTQSHNINYD